MLRFGALLQSLYKVNLIRLGFTLAVCISIFCFDALAYEGFDYSQENNPSDSLIFLRKPTELHLENFGLLKFRGVASFFGMAQSSPTLGDHNLMGDLSNAQVISYKDSGLVQYYFQAGMYSIPSLGTSYQRADNQTKNSFGLVPLASITISPDDYWSLSIGKINSFGGRESTFTFQNINIDRGLLWNQTSNVSKGAVLKYSDQAITVAATINDGFYSNEMSWFGASMGYQMNSDENLSATWFGSFKQNSANTFVTPLAQNNSQIFTVTYTAKSGSWMISPYLQYTYVPERSEIGIMSSAQTRAAAILMNYQIFKGSSAIYTLPFRVEYINSSGQTGQSPNLLYGVGSSAWSATITPTYQSGEFFARTELSYVQALNSTPGYAFGGAGNITNQKRFMIEFGILY